jgi:hypothetical protein
MYYYLYFEDIVLPNFVLVKLLNFCINTKLFTLTLQHICYHINPFFVTLFIGYENIIGDLYHITLKLRNNCSVFEVLPALTGDLLGNNEESDKEWVNMVTNMLQSKSKELRIYTEIQKFDKHKIWQDNVFKI